MKFQNVTNIQNPVTAKNKVRANYLEYYVKKNH